MPSLPPIIDTNITLGQWPTRRVACDDKEKLLAKLRAYNVTQAWTSHYDALFHANLTEVNNRLAEVCQNGVPLAPPVLFSEKHKLSQSELSPHKVAASPGATAGSPSSAKAKPH